MIITTNPCDGGFPIRSNLYISSLKLAGFARSGVKITFNLRVGITTKRSKIAIFSGSCSTFLLDSLGTEMKISMNPRHGSFPQRPTLYISSLKLIGFARSSRSEN